MTASRPALLPHFATHANGWRLAVADRLGFFSLAVIFFCGLPFDHLQRPAMVLLLLAFLLVAWDLRNSLLRSPLFWLVAAWIAYLLVRWVTATSALGAAAIDDFVSPDDFIRGSALVALLGGLWLRDDPVRLRWLLALSLAGVTLWLLLYADWAAVLEFHSPGRWIFGDNPNRVALVALFTLIGLLTVGLGWAVSAPLPKSARAALAAAAVVGSGAALWVIMTVNSRQAMLAAVITLPVLLFSMIHCIGRNHDWSRSIRLAVSAGLMAVLLTSTFFAVQINDAIEGRIVSATETLLAFEHGVQGSGPDNSVAIRLQMYTTGLERIAERPWFGWGPIDPTPWLPPPQPHWHNLYIQVAFAFGGVGLLLYLSGFGYAVWRFPRAARKAGFDPYVVLFGLLSTLAIALVLLLTVRIHQALGRYVLTVVFTVIAAPLLATWWPRTARTTSETP